MEVKRHGKTVDKKKCERRMTQEQRAGADNNRERHVKRKKEDNNRKN